MNARRARRQILVTIKPSKKTALKSLIPRTLKWGAREGPYLCSKACKAIFPYLLAKNKGPDLKFSTLSAYDLSVGQGSSISSLETRSPSLVKSLSVSLLS
jgi:hypothetical protein